MAGYAHQAGDIEIRVFGVGDSVAELTRLLNRAYRPLAEAGMRYVASWQGDDITRKRLANGECYLACVGVRVLGTILFSDATATRGCHWYDQPGVASFHQFAVEPEWQRLGVGTRLVEAAERRAVEIGAEEIALDTSEHAHHLIEWYARLGYRFIEHADWASTNYRSVIMSKRVRP